MLISLLSVPNIAITEKRYVCFVLWMYVAKLSSGNIVAVYSCTCLNSLSFPCNGNFFYNGIEQ